MKRSLDELNPFSRGFAGMLLEAHPEWEEFATPLEKHAGAFGATVPAPPPGRENLWISTVGDEITVGFSEFHKHFGWSDVPDPQAYLEALRFIEEILEEGVVISVVRSADRWVRSEVHLPEERPGLEPGQRASIRSWRGTHDREL